LGRLARCLFADQNVSLVIHSRSYQNLVDYSFCSSLLVNFGVLNLDGESFQTWALPVECPAD